MCLADSHHCLRRGVGVCRSRTKVNNPAPALPWQQKIWGAGRKRGGIGGMQDICRQKRLVQCRYKHPGLAEEWGVWAVASRRSGIPDSHHEGPHLPTKHHPLVPILQHLASRTPPLRPPDHIAVQDAAVNGDVEAGLAARTSPTKKRQKRRQHGFVGSRAVAAGVGPSQLRCPSTQSESARTGTD